MNEVKGMTLKEKLSKIQQELKAPKNLFNEFGGYSYRNAEGILEAFKSYEDKYKVGLIISDTVSDVGGRVYITANAELFDCESEESVTAYASAREQETKKGMDEAQITGAASSYARKYALNGLFLLDDTKDPDTDESRIESEARSASAKKIGETKAKALESMLNEKGVKAEVIYQQYNVKALAELTEEQHASVVRRLNKTK